MTAGSRRQPAFLDSDRACSSRGIGGDNRSNSGHDTDSSTTRGRDVCHSRVTTNPNHGLPIRAALIPVLVAPRATVTGVAAASLVWLS